MAQRYLLGSADEVKAGQLKTFQVNGTSIVVARTDQGYCAVENRCSHLPLPLASGKLEGNVIVCPWHGSRYDMCTGENLDWVRGVAGLTLPNWSRRILALGKQPQSIRAYQVVEEDGKLYVEF